MSNTIPKVPNPVEWIVNKLYTGNNVFLTGSAGTGKSYTIAEIKKSFRNPILLGSTGLSALNINGTTLHSYFQIGISKNLKELELYDEHRRARIIKGKDLSISRADEILFRSLSVSLHNADLIIIDEVSMVSKALWDLIYYRLSTVCPYKKIPILASGDLFQLPPVNTEEYC